MNDKLMPIGLPAPNECSFSSNALFTFFHDLNWVGFLQVVQYRREQTVDEHLQTLLNRAEQLVQGATGSTSFMERPQVPYNEDADIKIGAGAAAKGWSATAEGV